MKHFFFTPLTFVALVIIDLLTPYMNYFKLHQYPICYSCQMRFREPILKMGCIRKNVSKNQRSFILSFNFSEIFKTPLSLARYNKKIKNNNNMIKEIEYFFCLYVYITLFHIVPAHVIPLDSAKVKSYTSSKI